MKAMPSITAVSTRQRALSWWTRAALLAFALGATAAALPSRAQAADVQVRVLVDVADLIFRSGRPYYYDRGYYQPVVIEYDRWRRPVYYRYAPRPVYYAPPPVVVYRPAPPPRYYRAPPPHRYAPPPSYRVSYGDGRRHDGDRHDRGNHDRGRGRGHDKHRGRGWDD